MDNKLKIINKLGKEMEKSYTMHELSKELNIPYATFHRTIQQMEDLIIMQQIGKSKIIKLNIKNSIIKSYLAIASEQEKQDFIKNRPLIKKIMNETKEEEIVILFGSHAKNQETKKSDIDLFIINNKGKRSSSFSKLELLYNKEINAIYMTSQEFKQMLKDKEENLGKQVLKNHILLKHPEKFWEYVI